ncbi:MAG: EAL domain-containing protein [Papillibacter sp.]|nr:EAL domain-containing protein [Papillibacter sp.]
MGQEDIRREFKSIEEAFDSLPQKEREHCIRVSHYAEEIFLLACAADIYSDDVSVRVRLKLDQREAVADGARYMNIGKALVPELYHNIRPDFSPEEIALYRKHTTDGVKLVQSLLSEKMSSNPQALNIISEAIESHHEHWKGNGYPEGIKEGEIPIIARIMAIANALDKAASQKHSERPFEYAIEQLCSGSGTLYDPLLVNIVSESKGKLKKVFNKYINQSKAIPVIKPLISRTASRPFSLWYRPIAELKKNRTIAYEADMRFADKEKKWIPYSEVEHIIKREAMEHELGLYFITELGDMLRRLDACQIPAAYIVYTPPGGWLNQKGLSKELISLLNDIGTRPQRLCINLNQQMWEGKNKTTQENLKAMADFGTLIMLSGLTLNSVTADELKEYGVAQLRFGPEIGPRLDDKETTDYLSGLCGAGLTLLADGLEKKRHIALLNKNKIFYATSLVIGDYQTEDSLIESELALMDA